MPPRSQSFWPYRTAIKRPSVGNYRDDMVVMEESSGPFGIKCCILGMVVMRVHGTEGASTGVPEAGGRDEHADELLAQSVLHDIAALDKNAFEQTSRVKYTV
ncbi:hypothetical protein AcV5_005287 [Taiwanofungus camphoratus]|nr:hypothetical protein AcV5_005287 [Antrodia cinnamomea]